MSKEKNMKKIIITVLIFAVYTLLVCNVPTISEVDTTIIKFIQHNLNIPRSYTSILSGQALYYTMLYLPIIIGCICLASKKLYKHIIILSASPFIAYYINALFKNFIARPRPPIILQIGTHSASYSYVSTHTLVMFCVWGMLIFYINKYCTNQFYRYLVITFSVIWIILAGLSRIWLGVHNPTDVIGAYIMGSILLMIYTEISKLCNHSN